jgi:hypothetical protein
MFPGIASGFGFAWLMSFRIVITPAELIFRSLFRGKRSIEYNEIKIVRLARNFRRATGGPLRLIVESREGNKLKEQTSTQKFFRGQPLTPFLI